MTNRSFGHMIMPKSVSKTVMSEDDMPYKSMQQSKWMHVNKPELAKKWDKETNFKKLPKVATKSKWSKMGSK